MKILFAVASILTLLATAQIGMALEINSLTQEMESVYPHIVEYITDFAINTNDLDRVLSNQLHTVTLGDVKTSYAHITNSTVSISQYKSQKRVEYLTPLKVKVTNDMFTTFVMFSIHVLHIVGGKNYTCNVSIPQVFVSYIKEVDLESGNSIISGLNSTFSSKSFNEAVCKETESGKDKTRIDEAVNSTEGSSIYLQLKKSFGKMQQYFNTNAKGEHLSKIYEKNPYEYDYYGYKINVNVSTIQASKFGANGVENRMSGTIAGATKPAGATPAYLDGYSSFYSIEFFQNMIAYSKENYPAWKNIKLNGKNMRTSVFKYRLIDFEYIIPSILTRYPQNYLSDVEIECNIESMKDITMDVVNITQNIDWRCTGSFQTQPTKRETFLNFIVSANHIITIKTDDSRFIVYVNEVQITGLNFNIIGNYEIVDPALFAFFASQGLFEFRLYTIGCNFHISAPNNQIMLVPGKGIWVG